MSNKSPYKPVPAANSEPVIHPLSGQSSENKTPDVAPDKAKSLVEQRRLAVQMRLDGHTIQQTREGSGLSAPTIISAHKAYLAGGWAAIATKPRGRQSGKTSLSQDVQATLQQQLLSISPEKIDASQSLWNYSLARDWLESVGYKLSVRSATRYLQTWGFFGQHVLDRTENDPSGTLQSWLEGPCKTLLASSKRSSKSIYWVGLTDQPGQTVYFAYSARKQFFWTAETNSPHADACIKFLDRLTSFANGPCHLFVSDIDIARVQPLTQWLAAHQDLSYTQVPFGDFQSPPVNEEFANEKATTRQKSETTNNQTPLNTIKAENKSMTQSNESALARQTVVEDQSLTHLQQLEAESIAIIREVVAESENPAMLYSLGKDSAVMLDLAIKAFYPAPLPFPLVHIDTTWKFRAMYEHRDQLAKHSDLELLVHINPEGQAQNVNPFTHGSALHTQIMKTEGLKQAIKKYRLDTLLVGARRDEEKSRSKERIFSFRSAQHRWDPKAQRPELWNLYNTRKDPGESFRAHPLSNWTEFDIWHYISQENLTVNPLYFTADRPVVERDGALIVVDDDRMPLHDGEVPVIKPVRFRSLGCYPLTGAVESPATSIDSILHELLASKTSERLGRMIDHDSTTSLEKKKQEGYF